MAEDGFLSAREAAAELGITRSSLYAYVSRGLILSEPNTGRGKRSRRYRLDDVRRLKDRKDARRDPTKTAAAALHWGVPLLESRITLIADGRLSYRGRDAEQLARSCRVEEVAALLWESSGKHAVFAPVRLPLGWEVLRTWTERLPLLDRFGLALQLAAANDLGAHDLRPAAVRSAGSRILGLMQAVAADGHPPADGLAQGLADAWAGGRPEVVKLLNAALILAADHELNVSSFTVRCVASAGATPYAAVLAGLAALGGGKHGGLTERVEDLLHEVGRPEGACDAITRRVRWGDGIPGFGHPLYEKGDPRGRMLLDLAATAFADSQTVELASRVREEVLTVTGDHPTLDFGLAVLARALGLPVGSAVGIFALGRTIGWIGHALEQYQEDRLIRPRARYVGPAPVDDCAFRGANT